MNPHIVPFYNQRNPELAVDGIPDNCSLSV